MNPIPLRSWSTLHNQVVTIKFVPILLFLLHARVCTKTCQLLSILYNSNIKVLFSPVPYIKIKMKEKVYINKIKLLSLCLRVCPKTLSRVNLRTARGTCVKLGTVITLDPTNYFYFTEYYYSENNICIERIFFKVGMLVTIDLNKYFLL